MTSALRMRDDVAGCWEGGSAATGKLDEFSDIDLGVVAPLDSLIDYQRYVGGNADRDGRLRARAVRPHHMAGFVPA